MAQLFEDEKAYQDNRHRMNFVFFAYPFEPAIPQAEYNQVLADLQKEFPLRLWYFLDEVTTQELMRKIWRAILRSDLGFFDTSKGNPNVAFELGLAAGISRSCVTLVKTGEANPLGAADLGYSERVEYQSTATLKDRIRGVLKARSSALKLIRDLSYEIHGDVFGCTREELEGKIIELLNLIFASKSIKKPKATTIFGNEPRATIVMNALRLKDVLQVEGQKKGSRWVFSDKWVYHDHEVAGA